MLFSLIIPCYNSKNTIHRLFDSLTRQRIERDDLQVIVVDDNSSDKSYLDIVYSYNNRLNIEYYETDTYVHCPGNTRREGMKHIKGDWVCFCDHDDYFEDNAFGQIKEYILNLDHTAYVLSTIMNSYNEEQCEYENEYAHKGAWLHGKWYNVNELIKPYSINFKENLKTHEDIYFNSAVLNVLFYLDTDWDYLDIKTYRWVNEKDSITRKCYEDRGYMYENFNDYIISASEPFWKNAIETHDTKFINQLMMTLLHCYFYYECVSYLYGPDDYTDIIGYIKSLTHRIIRDLQCTLDDIVNFIYSDPYKYNKVKEDCDVYCLKGMYIPKTSCRDFIYYVGKDI